MSKRFKVGDFYHWGSPEGGGQLYRIVDKNRHFLFLHYGYVTRPEEVFVISKKAAREQAFNLPHPRGVQA